MPAGTLYRALAVLREPGDQLHVGMRIVLVLVTCPQVLFDLTVTQLGDSLPGIHETLGSISAFTQIDVMVHTCTLSTQQVTGRE